MKTSKGKSNRRLKALNISQEEFFERVLFLLGPPTQEFEKYATRYSRGLGEWIRKDPNGLRFRELVEGHGEGRTRAARLYSNYIRWFRYQANGWKWKEKK